MTAASTTSSKKWNTMRCNFDDDTGYADLKALLEKIDKERGTEGNRLFYLAVAPEYFSDIINRLGAHAWRIRKRAMPG